MQDLEPYSNWYHLYNAARDIRSPFFGRSYHKTLCTHTIYNYYIHPQWDEFGSPTLYIKILFVDYKNRFCIIEMLGEWNDCINNDIMFLKRNVIDLLTAEGIRYFILIGENVLNYHSDTDDYYQEWFDEIEDGYIIGLNFREHVVQEFMHARLDNYMLFGGRFSEIPWRRFSPQQLFDLTKKMITRRLSE